MAEPYPARTFIQNQIGIGLATQRNFRETSHVPVRPDRSLFLHLPPEQFRLQHTIGRISAVERKVRAFPEKVRTSDDLPEKPAERGSAAQVFISRAFGIEESHLVGRKIQLDAIVFQAI